MNILAVIPAQKKSKRIPNLNIRILNGHPLIYYVIKNALSSKYITEVVVSTDSNEIADIAKQMNVGVKWRADELCRDQVTLDSVVYDAISNEKEWDYIITLQPTSPILKSETLDKAIKKMFKSDIDTIIPVLNQPRLSWKIKDGEYIPNYDKRVNTDYMEPLFIENGAFMISKACIVTQQTRIGNKVELFEIDKREALEIREFDDLKMASSYLNIPKIGIYVNGNNTQGMGHVYRVLELADEFYAKPDIYYDENQTNREVFGDTYYNLIPIKSIEELYEKCKKEKYTIFINDILTTSLKYMRGLRTALSNSKIVNFEDDGEGIEQADIVFNALYERVDLNNVYAGEKYYIANKTFLMYEPIKIKDRVERVLITFGGADPQNYTDRMLEIISKPLYKNVSFLVVLGRAKENVNQLMNYNVYENIEVIYDVANMAKIMSECDVAITSRGRTGYELALLGIPTIAMAQNKREEKHVFVSNENGFSYIGLNPDDEIIESHLRMYIGMSKDVRRRFQNKLLSHDLRNGRKRIMGLIEML